MREYTNITKYISYFCHVLKLNECGAIRETISRSGKPGICSYRSEYDHQPHTNKHRTDFKGRVLNLNSTRRTRKEMANKVFEKSSKHHFFPRLNKTLQRRIQEIPCVVDCL